MEVKRGYKQTEVGTIPKDWEVHCLRAISSQITDGDHVTPKRVRVGYYLLSARNVRDGRLDLSDVDYVGPAEFNRMRLRCAPLPSDILVSCSGHGLGRVSMVPAGLQCVLVRSAALVKVNRKNADSSFVHYWLRSAHAQNQISIQISRAAQPNLFLNNIEKLLTPLPPTKAEQEAIAEALSDADAHIESLEQLIAKKRQIKQGAMQELLTGKRRLPGYSGKWETKRLDELGQWTGGMTPSMRNPAYWTPGTVPWISSGDVKAARLTTTSFSISDLAVKQRATTVLPKGSIILVTRSGILRRYLPVATNMVAMAINQDVKAIIPNDRVKADFLLHSLIHHGDQILGRCLKSGTTVESIEFPWLKAFSIPIPLLTEQIAVAVLLNEMADEIEVLETKVTKARQLKQGMMQQLLTGRIRLV